MTSHKRFTMSIKPHLLTTSVTDRNPRLHHFDIQFTLFHQHHYHQGSLSLCFSQSWLCLLTSFLYGRPQTHHQKGQVGLYPRPGRTVVVEVGVLVSFFFKRKRDQKQCPCCSLLSFSFSFFGECEEKGFWNFCGKSKEGFGWEEYIFNQQTLEKKPKLPPHSSCILRL